MAPLLCAKTIGNIFGFTAYEPCREFMGTFTVSNMEAFDNKKEQLQSILEDEWSKIPPAITKKIGNINVFTTWSHC